MTWSELVVGTVVVVVVVVGGIVVVEVVVVVGVVVVVVEVVVSVDVEVDVLAVVVEVVEVGEVVVAVVVDSEQAVRAKRNRIKLKSNRSFRMVFLTFFDGCLIIISKPKVKGKKCLLPLF
jgi:hypothetical protein